MALILMAAHTIDQWERCIAGLIEYNEHTMACDKMNAAYWLLSDLEARALAPCPQPIKRIHMNQSEWEEVFPDIPWRIH